MSRAPKSAAIACAVLSAAVAAAAESSLTSVDLYGLRTVDEAEVRAAIGVSAGEELAESNDAIEARIAALDGVVEARVSLVRYPGNLALFVGVREEAAPSPARRAAPAGEVTLDPELLALTRRKSEFLLPAIRSGQAGEDHDHGHALSEYPPLRELELGLTAIADQRFEELARVLRTSADARSRAAAATILAYAGDKARVAPELEHAATDPDAVVRNNGVRALGILVEYAREHPELAIDVDEAPLLALLGSFDWTDRNKGAAVVDALTKGRDEALLSTVAADHLDEVVEMARWDSRGHATFSIRILARIAGLSEEEIVDGLAASDDPAARAAWLDELEAAARNRSSDG